MFAQVVSAFHVGRGGMSMSYMGRGVTRSATLCLRHLACEMATQLHSPVTTTSCIALSQRPTLHQKNNVVISF